MLLLVLGTYKVGSTVECQNSFLFLVILSLIIMNFIIYNIFELLLYMSFRIK